MARSRPARPGLPSPETIVLEFPLLPPAAAVSGAERRTIAARTQYRVLRTTQVDPYDKPASMEAILAAAPPGDNFAGESRRAAKISIADAPLESFSDVKALVATLPTEKKMKNHVPKITTKSTSDRVKEEKRNVKIRGFLYAASREKDNDYHLIVGRSPQQPPMYMTIEISGLPPASSPHRTKLKKARDTYKNFFQIHDMGLPGTSYDFYDPPIPVEISGSLFFDINHVKGGRPGPDDLRPDIPTVWEIHPITKIVFEP